MDAGENEETDLLGAVPRHKAQGGQDEEELGACDSLGEEGGPGRGCRVGCPRWAGAAAAAGAAAGGEFVAKPFFQL